VSNGDTFYIKVVAFDEIYNFIYSFKFFHMRSLSWACDVTVHVARQRVLAAPQTLARPKVLDLKIKK
jgi:hypothetical protein